MPRRLLTDEESGRRWDEYSLRNLEGDVVRWMSESWEFHLPLYWRIQKHVAPGGRILEVGAGGGQNLLWLASRGYECTGLEYRDAVVSASKELASRLGSDVQLELGDAFDLSDYRGFDLAFSLGMIEHWEPDRSVAALREQAAAARIVIVVIPTENTRYADPVTDERFYRPGQLRALMRRAGLTEVRSFAYGTAPTRRVRLARQVLPPLLLASIQNVTRWGAASHAAIGLAQSAS